MRLDFVFWETQEPYDSNEVFPLDDVVEGATRFAEVVDAAGDVGVFDEGRGVVGFEAGVDEEGAVAAPVFVVDEAVDAVDIVGGVGAGEGGPEEIIEGAGGEVAVVGEDE